VLRNPLVGQTAEEAGLRALEAAYLVHPRRGDERIPMENLRNRVVAE